MKKPRLSVVEKIRAAQAAPVPADVPAPAPDPIVSLQDLANLVFAARRAIGSLSAFDMRNVSASIDAAERMVAHRTRQAPTPSAAPAAKAEG